MTAPDHAAERKRIVLVNTAMEARLLTALDAREGELQAALARAEAAEGDAERWRTWHAVAEGDLAQNGAATTEIEAELTTANARIAALEEGLRQLVEFAEGEVSDTIDWSETSIDFDEAWGAIVPDARALLTPEPPAVKDATK